MKTVQSPRTQMRHRSGWSGTSVGGFTLVEMMVAIAILAIIGAAAFAGIRQEQYRGQYKRFVDDAQGALVTARNAAIDRQTLVRVTLDDTQMQITALDQDTEVWELVDRVAVDGARDKFVEDHVCLHGFSSGVQTPAQAVNIVPPAGCLGSEQIIQFEPDGGFTDPDDSFTTIDNAGVTLWVGNHQMGGDLRYAFIQVFPGGLIRAFDKVEMGGAT